MAPCWPFALLHPADHTCLVTDFCLLTPPHNLSPGPLPGVAKLQPLDGMTQDEESPNPHPALKPHSKGVSTHPCSDPVALRSKGMGASGREARGDLSGNKKPVWASPYPQQQGSAPSYLLTGRHTWAVFASIREACKQEAAKAGEHA